MPPLITFTVSVLSEVLSGILCPAAKVMIPLEASMLTPSGAFSSEKCNPIVEPVTVGRFETHPCPGNSVTGKLSE